MNKIVTPYPPSSEHPEPAVAKAYDGSNVTYRLLRAFGWGPLLNLGYYPFPRPFTALNFVLTPGLLAPHFRLPLAQMRLVKKTIALLQLVGRHNVLDVGCGRGAGSFMLANAYPAAVVTGIDILRDNVHAARTFYANRRNLAYIQADATALPFRAASFDRLLCLEAAFHFPNRLSFLKDAARVLTPRGRLVVVDFVWKTDNDHRALSAEVTELVRNTWQWENFASMTEYEANGASCDLNLVGRYDWSPHVTDPLQTVFRLVAWLARRSWGQRLATLFNPLLRSLSPADWSDLEQSARAHTAVRERSSYMALVFERQG